VSDFHFHLDFGSRLSCGTNGCFIKVAHRIALTFMKCAHLIAQGFGLFRKAFMNLFDLFLLSVSQVQSSQRPKVTWAAWSSRAAGSVSERAGRRSRRTVRALRRILRKNDSGCRQQERARDSRSDAEFFPVQFHVNTPFENSWVKSTCATFYLFDELVACEGELYDKRATTLAIRVFRLD
jgi:hypothetical protein